MQSNVVQSSVSPNIVQQIPLVNSTQMLTQTQINPVTTSTSPGLNNPQISVSYAPIVSAIKPPEPAGHRPKVTVVPIYD